MLVQITLDGQTKLISTLDQKNKAMVKGIMKELRASGRTIATQAGSAAPQFTGTLASRVRVTSSARFLGARVSLFAPHSWIIGRGGRQPGAKMPPPKQLVEWVKARGLATTEAAARSMAFVIARSIAAKGIKPNLFLDRAFAAEHPNLVQRLRRILEEVFRSEGGAA